jgi:hypothetical protein
LKITVTAYAVAVICVLYPDDQDRNVRYFRIQFQNCEV